MRRLASVFLFGFSSGLPLLLTASTLQAWMVDEKVELAMVGLFSLVGLPYSLKFLWAPLMDRYVPPFLGRRRGWMLIAQAALLVSIGAIGFWNPASHPTAIAGVALLISFFSASQDISVDAYNTELLKPEEYGLGSTIYATGYRVAMLVSGSLALILADHAPWRFVYLAMAAVMLVGIGTSFWAPEPAMPAAAPKTLREAVIEPLREFFSRPGAVEMLFFLILYRIDYNMTWTMTTPFVMGLGFSKTDIGVVTKGFGMLATIGGGLAGGGLIYALGIWRAMLLFGAAQAASSLCYLGLAHAGHSYPWMVLAIAVENLCGGMANAAFTAFMMSLCDKRFTATQFALITSFMALSRSVAGAPSGLLAQGLGWPSFFLLCAFTGAPALILLSLRGKRWMRPTS
jgi:PAT family beta-lactamase induction signal transducer AmpG